MALLRREFLDGSRCSEVMGIQWLAKPDLLPVRIPQVKLRVKSLFDKLKKIRKILLVGAPGFEPGTSCAQGRRATRLRYAPTGSALFILKYFPTLLRIHITVFSPDCARMGYCSMAVHNSDVPCVGISLALGGQIKSGQLGSDQNWPTEVARNC
jgi:hypothetical protein